jgi:S-DNA-T family DNA segregation ATPase FtsK/SpoIIIE
MSAKKPTTKKTPSRSNSAGRGDQAKASQTGEVRRAINGRESEFVAIAFIVLGVIVGLAVYARLAGPVGRGADTALGCLLGLGRYCLPLVFIAIGVAQLRGDEAPNRVKLALGWGGVVLSALGILHVFKGPDAFTGVDALGGAGGWLGAILGQVLQVTIGDIAAVLVLTALALGCSLLISSLSLKDSASAVGSFFSTIVSGAGTRARSLSQSLGTISEDEDEADVETDADDEDAAGEYDELEVQPLDHEEPEVEPELVEVFVPAVKTPRPPAEVDVPHTQGQFDTPPISAREWKLPPLSYLTRSGKQAIDQSEVTQRGKDLEAALLSHGVTVTLVDQTVGPTVTRYELELGTYNPAVTSPDHDECFVTLSLTQNTDNLTSQS